MRTSRAAGKGTVQYPPVCYNGSSMDRFTNSLLHLRSWLAHAGARIAWRDPRLQSGLGSLLVACLSVALAVHASGAGLHRRPPAIRQVAARSKAATVTRVASPAAVPSSATPLLTLTNTPPDTATATITVTDPPTAPHPTATAPRPTATPAQSATFTAVATGTLPPTSTPTIAATASVTPTPSLSPTATATDTPVPTATVDPVYYAEDTLAGTGPGPAGPLSGLPTTPAHANRRAIAVVIDNYAPDARPQTGLNRASLVFETLAEGGITRLLAVYLERDAPLVGPVRSARIYFNAWAAGLRAIYAHAGGNSDALYQLGHLRSMRAAVDVDDLNLPIAPDAADQPYWRTYDRAAPHNLYTATAQLRGYTLQAGRPAYGVSPAALPHRVPDPYFHRPDTASIDVGFSSYAYNVHWSYDRTTNTYLRSVGGLTAADPLSRRPVAPSNVVVLFTPVTPDPDPFASDGVNVHTVGTGRALYFRDGHLVRGSWRKAAIAAPVELLDSEQNPQPLNPGQAWIEVIPAGAPVTWLGA